MVRRLRRLQIYFFTLACAFGCICLVTLRYQPPLVPSLSGKYDVFTLPTSQDRALPQEVLVPIQLDSGPVAFNGTFPLVHQADTPLSSSTKNVDDEIFFPKQQQQQQHKSTVQDENKDNHHLTGTGAGIISKLSFGWEKLRSFYKPTLPPTPTTTTAVPVLYNPGCLCELPEPLAGQLKTRWVNFCYNFIDRIPGGAKPLSQNSIPVIGQRFSCDFVRHLGAYGLLIDEPKITVLPTQPHPNEQNFYNDSYMYNLNNDYDATVQDEGELKNSRFGFVGRFLSGLLGAVTGGDMPKNGTNQSEAGPPKSIDPIFVTAVSAGHFNKAQRLALHMQRYHPNTTLYIYDLGLTGQHRDIVSDMCNTHLVPFDFNTFPPHVKQLGNFAWKPLVIAHALRNLSSGSVWYMDSSVVFRHGDLRRVHALATCSKSNNTIDNQQQGSRPTTFNLNNSIKIGNNNNNLSGVSTTSTPTISMTHADAANTEDWIESGFHESRWVRAMARCDKFPGYMLQGYSGTGIYSYTNPGLYKYFPTNVERLKIRQARMYNAGLVLVRDEPGARKDILKWLVLCALQSDCISPPGASAGCSGGPDKFSRPPLGGCHRFDQSVINLLLANRLGFHSYFWTSEIVDYFDILRGMSGGLGELCSLKARATTSTYRNNTTGISVKSSAKPTPKTHSP